MSGKLFFSVRLAGIPGCLDRSAAVTASLGRQRTSVARSVSLHGEGIPLHERGQLCADSTGKVGQVIKKAFQLNLKLPQKFTYFLTFVQSVEILTLQIVGKSKCYIVDGLWSPE